MHYFTWNIGDYLKDTGGLSLIEHGAYSLLLQWAYANEKPLPLEQERLFRIASAVTKADQRAVTAVLDQFFQCQDDGFHHKRVISEIQKFYRRSEAGTKNIGKRYETPTKSLPNDDEAATKQADNHNARKTNTSETSNHLLEAAASESAPELDSSDVPPSDSPSGWTAKKKKGGAVRERNAVLDALAIVGGGALESVTRPMWGEAAKALKDIRQVCPEVTAEQITAAAAAHRAEWPKASCSPSSLAKHWAKFGPQKKEGGGNGKSVEPEWNWRDFAAFKCGIEVGCLAWRDVLERLREQILDAWKRAAPEVLKLYSQEVPR
jgi:uncharacterized protein YdaU (DUF1376 family)